MHEGFRFRGFHSPNYTQVPDELFDELLAVLSGAELKVVLYVIRRTFGFKRESDNISLSQMLRGIRTKDGRRLDRGVGLSKPTLLKAIRGCVEKNIIIPTRRSSSERGDEATNYRLNIAGETTQPAPRTPSSNGSGSRHAEDGTPLVKDSNQGGSRTFTTPVVKEVPQALVKKLATQDTGDKKQSYTRVGVSEERGTSMPHLELVAHFHRKAGHPATQPAAPKESKQAKDLLAEHPLETCRTIVDLALERAAETSFKPRHFGAVLSYVPEALASLEQHQARRQREQDERRRRLEDDARIEAERSAYLELPADERLARRLERSIAIFKTLERRDPTPAELEDLRRKLSSKESATA